MHWPKNLAIKIKDFFNKEIDNFKKIEIAGPGFLNIQLSNSALIKNINSIIEINQNLTDDAALINQSAEASGWIFKLKISNHSQLNDLMTLVQYEEFLKQE